MYSSRRHFRLNNSWTMSRKVQKKLMDYTETRPLKCELRISLVFWLNVWQVTKELEIGIGHFAVFTYNQLSVNCIEMIFPLISLVLVVTSHQRNGNQTGISRFDQLSVNCIEIILFHGNIMYLNDYNYVFCKDYGQLNKISTYTYEKVYISEKIPSFWYLNIFKDLGFFDS